MFTQIFKPTCAQASMEQLKCVGCMANLTFLSTCGEHLVLLTYLLQTQGEKKLLKMKGVWNEREPPP